MQKAKSCPNMSLPIKKHAPSMYGKTLPNKNLSNLYTIQIDYSTQTTLFIQDLMENQPNSP